MILRRFMQHIREQNWFAVGLDVIVVIVGIFLGLQVQNWYEERGERVQENLFLSRMHTEVTENLGYQDELSDTFVFLNRLNRTSELLSETLSFFNGERDNSGLGYEHCAAIIASHINWNSMVTLPTVSELLSSGQFSLIQSEEIKAAVSEYLRAKETLNAIVTHLESIMLVLHRKYPDLIKFDLSARGVGLRIEAEHHCNFEQMALNHAFKNDLADNASKFYAYLNAASVNQKSLEKIHKNLDQELGNFH